MRKILLAAAALIATSAMAAGPIIWNGANSRDLTTDGLLTPRLTLPENAVVTSADQIIVRAPASITAPWTLTLPGDPGTADFVLTTNGSGVTEWQDATGLIIGPANTFAGFDAAGNITAVPGWNYDPANFDGVTVDNTIVPVTATSGTLNTYRTVVNPAATVTNTTWIQTQHEMNIGTGNGANMDDVVGMQVNVNSREDSDVDNLTLFQANADIGDNDAITVTNINGIQNSIDIDDQATVQGVVGITSNTNSAAGSQITGLTQVQIGGNIDTVTGGYAGVNITPNITAVNTVNGSFFGGTITTAGSNVTGFSSSPTVTNELTGSYSGFTNSPNLGETNGAQGFSDFAQVDDNQTNSYQSVVAAPTVTVANSYTSFSGAPSLGTIENGYGLSDGPNVTSVENYTSANLGGVFTTVTDNYKGVNIAPTATGDGTGSAVGLGINMGSVTGFTSGQVYAIQATGNADIQGRFNAFSAYTPVDGGGNPGSVHGLITAIGVPDNATIANADTIGVNTASLMSLGSNSTITSGPFGLGLAALAFPSVLTMETGASADYVHGALFALSLDPANTGGTIDQVNLARATAVPQGGTQTITELRGYFTNLPFGDPGTTSWGLYSEDFPQNFMEGNLRLGGTPGSSDTTAARLQVQGNALLQNASGSQPQLILSEDPDNGTNTMAIQAAATLGADFTLTFPVDDGASGQVLTTDGSGNLTWSNAATLPINLTTGVTGVLPIANGGTNKALTLAAGGLVWTDADSFEVGAAGTAQQWALSGGTGAPTFSNTTTTGKTIDGSADEVQLTVQGNGTQTSAIFVAETSAGTDLLTVNNATITATAPVTLSGSGGNVPFSCTRRTNACLSTTSCELDCSAGEIVVGGGCTVGGTVAINDSYPLDADTWRCVSAASANLDAVGICCSD